MRRCMSDGQVYQHLIGDCSVRIVRGNNEINVTVVRDHGLFRSGGEDIQCSEVEVAVV